MPKAKPRIEDVKSLARVHSARAVQVLAGIMDQPDCPPPARVAAAVALLDRGWGKPEQHQTGSVNHQHYIARVPTVSTSVEEWNKTVEPLRIAGPNPNLQ